MTLRVLTIRAGKIYAQNCASTFTDYGFFSVGTKQDVFRL